MKRQLVFVLAFTFLVSASSVLAGTLAAWGCGNLGGCDVPDGNDFVAVSGGSEYGVAIRTDGSLAAWGADHNGTVSDTPGGNDFIDVEGGYTHALALKADGSIVAWGDDSGGGQVWDTPDGNDYIAVSAGSTHSLAIRFDGSLEAWGYGTSPGERNYPPAGSIFVAIAAGESHNLALTTDGSLVDWGGTFGGQPVPEGNDFVGIDVGRGHGIALKSDGSIVAWGVDDHNQVSGAPSGTDFVAVAAGDLHNIALKSDGSIVGWGYDAQNQASDVPAGYFTQISCGRYHSLALTHGHHILTVLTEPADVNTTTPYAGEHLLFGFVDIDAQVFLNCPDVYRFSHWDGDVSDPNSPSTTVFMDADKTITAVYVLAVPICGDECHPYPEGDLNQDCITDFNDFAMFSQGWLRCTKPECD